MKSLLLMNCFMVVVIALVQTPAFAQDASGDPTVTDSAEAASPSDGMDAVSPQAVQGEMQQGSSCTTANKCHPRKCCKVRRERKRSRCRS